jgi:ariadne-1
MYECPNCKTHWKDPINYSNWDKIKNFFTFRNGKRFEILSRFYKYMFTKSCPGCGIPIQKNGGCSHMNCKKCNS